MFDILGAIVAACLEAVRPVFNSFGGLGLISAMMFAFVVGAILLLRKRQRACK
jgi:hypothetical protein